MTLTFPFISGLDEKLNIYKTKRTLMAEAQSDYDGGGVLGKAQGASGEADPTGRSAHTEGAKLDAGKAPVFRGLLDYFPRACMAVADISAFGASKYLWKGWETVPDGVNRYSDAEVRHITKEAKGELRDDDSGHLHAAHRAWNAMAVLELKLRELENND